MKQKLIPILSIAIGLVAFALTAHYLRSEKRKLEMERQRLYGGARRVAVVAAAQDIPAETTIKVEDLGQISIPESAFTERHITVDQYRQVVGRKTLLPINGREPILWSDIQGGALSEGLLASIVTPGMRAVSLAIGGADAVSGMVEPNDKVDVLGTFTFPSRKKPGEMETVTLTLLQDVTVLAVGQKMANRRSLPGAAASARTVTLEVTPREAEALVFAQQLKGGLTLTLRNPADVSFESNLPEVDFQYIDQRLPELNLYRQRNIRHKKNL